MVKNLTTKVKRVYEMSEADQKAWAELRLANPHTYSPYFHLDYTRLLSELRDDVYIACIYKGQTPIGFLPYQGRRFARPVGAPMTDYHGFISHPDNIEPLDVIKAAGIGAFHFSSSVNTSLQSFAQSEDEGVLMNIKNGAEAWRKERDSSYRRHLKSNRRRIRKASEDIGAPRFEWVINRSGDFRSTY